MFLHIVQELFFGTTENVYVHVSMNTTYTSIRRQLPIQQMHKRLKFTITGYPNIIIQQLFRSMRKIIIHETLPHIQKRTSSRTCFYYTQPRQHFTKHGL